MRQHEQHLICFWEHVESIVDKALIEDRISHDVTTDALIPDHLEGKVAIVAKAEGVLAGVEIAKAVFMHVDPTLLVEVHITDGHRVKKGDVVATITGEIVSILKAERPALNFLCHLSGIATDTSKYVDAVKGTNARITDTRKTTPGLRPFEKYAVRMGGGQSHREHLGDWILIKDNHLAALRCLGLGIRDAIEKARNGSPAGETTKVEVEVNSFDQAVEAIGAGADIVMLDNMSIAQMKRVMEINRGRTLIEASGGMNLDNVRSVAELGVDLISIGALTHSSKALDLSLKIVIC
ncbi:MAG: carboxylating nicotinate-nucleotide diphosphorylase [Dehalococcoidia bacterium]|jgi:nicotinate-nucleotide pyrophosphorylase (carboxylating)